jgi:FkbM family methyltransferase
MLASRLKSHFKHSRDQIVGSVKIGSQKYKIRGYLPSRLATPTEYEPHVAFTISKILQKRKGVFIDVGANVGQTLFTLLRVDPHCSYLGFEPQVACCHYLQQFIEDNLLMPRIRIFPVALSSKTGFLPFFSNNAQDNMGSLLPELWQPKNEQFVCARKGDEALTELGASTISAIKIDVEGAEISVLTGLQKTLEIMRPPVIFEVLPNFIGHDLIMLEESTCARRRAAADDIYQLLSSVGYTIFQIDEKSRTLFSIKQFNLDDRDSFHGLDYVAVESADYF